MATASEKGLIDNPSWTRETAEYLSRLPPALRPNWLDHLSTQIQQWTKSQDKLRVSPTGLWSDGFPWMWELESSGPHTSVVTERAFDSIEGFVDCLQTRSAEPRRTRMILICSEYERTKGLIPKGGEPWFDWWTSLFSLALLGSRWEIAPEILFPVVKSWNDLWSNESKTRPEPLEGEQVVNSVDSLTLPSKRHMNSIVPISHDKHVAECLFLATTLTPQRLDKDFLNTFKSHYDKPDYHSLRLIKIPPSTKTSQAIGRYVVVCNSRKVRAALKNSLAVRSFGNGGSPNEFGDIRLGNTPVSLVRFFKQYVIDQLCHNLNILKTNLEEAKYSGRKDPSYNKINYVLHLRDHLEIMERFLDYSARELPGLPDSKALDETDEWPAAFKGDQGYLRGAIASLKRESNQVHDTIKIQIDNKNSSRNILFAVLASLYLPFSLVTSVFGMNIKEINNSAPKWSAVVALGLPLAVVTVALPLGFGFGYRKVTEFVSKNPKLFRILAWGGIGFVFVAVVIIVVIVVQITKNK